ncbi:MAG: methylated-DNA--[protein]-cysteine S-methyltransferase [Senegalia sp. (in: firmicutes)]|uniref:methylated-DNA--[protein]-cysteine S-methyltransferase n=1 Tax=Senegalia sp. (in: firmicutes) TaxID=1924098 RepID=UPI003F9A7B41
MSKKNSNYLLYLDSPLGIIEITADDKDILSVNFVDKKDKKENHNDIILECKEQLVEYFKGDRKEFTISFKLQGTEFQKKVWNELKNIKYGKTCSYGEIAKNINNKNASRAVGGANNKNNISIIIPCHRVIGSSGKLVGYGGGISKKEWLLNHERENNDE